MRIGATLHHLVRGFSTFIIRYFKSLYTREKIQIPDYFPWILGCYSNGGKAVSFVNILTKLTCVRLHLGEARQNYFLLVQYQESLKTSIKLDEEHQNSGDIFKMFKKTFVALRVLYYICITL